MGMRPALSLHRRWCFFGLSVLLCAFVATHTSSVVVAQSVPTDLRGRLTAGANHTCAIASDDAVWCWGDNTYFQLGTTAVADTSFVPVKVADNFRATHISAGSNHTCALTHDRSVWCWGENTFSGLGQSGADSATPLRVELESDAVAIATGGNSSCAVLASQVVKCWGANINRQLGNGTSTNSASPTQVSKVPSDFTVTQLDMGANHTCAVSAASAVWCWGLETEGRLGRSIAVTTVPLPTDNLIQSAVHVSAGGQHTCVALSNGFLQCFGKNNAGQLGWDKTEKASSAEPLQVTNVGSALAVAAGGAHTCVRTSTGTVQCFGYNNFGQIGVSPTGMNDRYAPAVVAGATDVVELVAGESHTCVLIANGDVKCWGSNMKGQVGLASDNATHVPTRVGTLNVKPPEPEPEPDPDPEPEVVLEHTPQQEPAVVPPAPQVTAQPSVVGGQSSEPASVPVAAAQLVEASPSTSAKKPLVTSLRLRKGRSLSAAKIAASVSIGIPKKSQGVMRISIMRGTKNCKFVGSTIRGVRRGKCQVLVVRIPKKGKPLLRGNTITVV